MDGNNNVPGVIIEAWANGERNLKSARSITISPVELSQIKSYTAQKASASLGDKTVDLFEIPTYQTPYGLEIATVDLVETQYINKNDLNLIGYGSDRDRDPSKPNYGIA